jgi:hypothetical protein
MRNSGGAGLLRDTDQFPNLNTVASLKGCSPERLVLAYMAAKWPCITHITSARREVSAPLPTVLLLTSTL